MASAKDSSQPADPGGWKGRKVKKRPHTSHGIHSTSRVPAMCTPEQYRISFCVLDCDLLWRRGWLQPGTHPSWRIQEVGRAEWSSKDQTLHHETSNNTKVLANNTRAVQNVMG